jgi:hypothetical protein
MNTDIQIEQRNNTQSQRVQPEKEEAAATEPCQSVAAEELSQRMAINAPPLQTNDQPPSAFIEDDGLQNSNALKFLMPPTATGITMDQQ